MRKQQQMLTQPNASQVQRTAQLRTANQHMAQAQMALNQNAKIKLVLFAEQLASIVSFELSSECRRVANFFDRIATGAQYLP